MSGAATRPIAIAEPYLGDEEFAALSAPLERGWLTQGPEAAEFERRFAETYGDEAAAEIAGRLTA